MVPCPKKRPCTFYIRFPKCHFLHHFASDWRTDGDIGKGELELPALLPVNSLVDRKSKRIIRTHRSFGELVKGGFIKSNQ